MPSTKIGMFSKSFELPVLDNLIEVTVHYDISSGRPQTGPSFASTGGSPAEPPEIENMSAEFTNGEPMPATLQDIIIEYVADHYEDDLFDIDHDDDYPEPDDYPDRDED